jgi:DNA-binding Lrp family transcriptional regulator
MKLSDHDRRLLQELQRDASLSLAVLAERCGMAQSTLWRKLQDFEARGLILARVALLSPQHLDCKLTVLAAISLPDHSDKVVSGFVALARSHPEITECMSVSGNADYHLKIRTRDVETYEHFLTHVLLRSAFVREVQSSFVLKEIKSTTELPI